MPNVSLELIEEAFIAPIRFALLVDDQFPIYSKIVDKAPAASQDSDRAAKLFNFCRGKGWLCDVDNGASDKDQERISHLHQSDLLVVDFHLDPAKQEDPARALQILQQLAQSEHMNLVIIYTAAEPPSVVQEVAFSLGAGVTLDADKFKNGVQWLEDLDPDIERTISVQLNTAVLDNFLYGKKPNGDSNALRKAIQEAGAATGDLQNLVINVLCQLAMETRVTPDVVARRAKQQGARVSFGKKDESFWVTQGNVFVVVVNKQDEPAVLVERLRSALVAWNPPALQVMMVHARAALERAGRLPDEKVLESSRRQAGWILRILLGETAEIRRTHLQELYDRIFGRLVNTISTSISEFGSKVFEPMAGVTPLLQAATMAGDESLNEIVVFHALNEHLCSEPHVDDYISTGVVFRSLINGTWDYWVCSSPACDLVPGQATGWDGEMKPLLPITAARLNPIRQSVTVGTLLQDATHCRHLFLSEGGKPIALEIVDSKSRQMRLEMMLVEKEGRIENASFSARVLRVDGDGKPTTNNVDFEVVGMLRKDYANRILAESGQQRARIGVDYVNRPR
ncbi:MULTISPECIES: response regulator receiver domain [Polaromonas]|uniref:Response regulator receiver domain n=1 Tax=Polaromonas aquatica TaxID=332657 RepID=A0ABW1TVW9_9BURK